MSRRKLRKDTTFGQLVLQCPHGHALGALVMTRFGDIHRIDQPLTDETPEAQLQPLTLEDKVKVDCPACRESGRRPDYQASVALVTELLQLQLADTHSEHRTFKFS
jgi:hypothetical protein